MTIAILLSIIGSLLALDAIRWHVVFRRAVARRRVVGAPLRRYPSVTVVRPVKGLDVGAVDNFRAALDTGYPGHVETIFVFDDPADPGFEAARAVVLEHAASGAPGTARILVAGEPPPGRTGKVNAMVAGAEAATGELVAFGDSDTRPDRDVLRVLVETLMSAPRGGAAFAQVVVSGPPRTAGDAGQAMLVNALYGPNVAYQAAPAGDLPFIMGQLMVFRRKALDAIGGPAAADGHLVDDMHLGACVHRAGFRNLVSPHPLPIATDGLSAARFLRMMRRWLLFQRGGLPRSFTWPLWLKGVEVWSATALAAYALASGRPVAAIAPAAAVLVQVWSLLRLNRVFGGSPMPARFVLAPLLLFWVAPLVHLAAVLHPTVNWRGRVYAVDRDARLARPQHPTPGPAQVEAIAGRRSAGR